MSATGRKGRAVTQQIAGLSIYTGSASFPVALVRVHGMRARKKKAGSRRLFIRE
jgi:hypothetical protein